MAWPLLHGMSYSQSIDKVHALLAHRSVYADLTIV